jgi:serine/threonine protein phosphatase PrpC/CRP-like cAMP-binding protein
MQVQFWAATDVGLTRDHNEDNYLVDPNLSLFVVADGMGGHAAGEIASSVAVHEVREAIKKQKEVIEGYKKSGSVLQRQTVLTLLEQAILTACKSVYQCAQEDSERHGMGTTLSLLLLARNRAFVGHVGDSRIYRTRKDVVSQITEDHTVINELIKSGRISPDDAFNSPYKNAVTRAVGVHPSVEVDTFDFEVQKGDNYLLCSDGLSGYLDEDGHQAFDYLHQSDVKKVPQDFIDFANQAGGKDNITAIIVRVDDIETPILTTSFGVLPPLPNSSMKRPSNDLDEIDGLEAEESIVNVTDDELASVNDPQRLSNLSSSQNSDQAPPPLPPLVNKTQEETIRPAVKELDNLPINLLKVSPLFALLGNDSLESFVSAAEIVELEENAALQIKGDEDDSLYFLYSGELRLENDEEIVDTLIIGATLGEDQLLMMSPIMYNVIANEACSLLRWRRESLHMVMANSPEISSRIMWGLALFSQRRVKRLQRSLHMLNELFDNTLSQYVPQDHPVNSSWKEQAKTLVNSTPSSNEVYSPIDDLPRFTRDLPESPNATFEMSLNEVAESIESEIEFE